MPIGGGPAPPAPQTCLHTYLRTHAPHPHHTLQEFTHPSVPILPPPSPLLLISCCPMVKFTRAHCCGSSPVRTPHLRICRRIRTAPTLTDTAPYTLHAALHTPRAALLRVCYIHPGCFLRLLQRHCATRAGACAALSGWFYLQPTSLPPRRAARISRSPVHPGSDEPTRSNSTAAFGFHTG